MTTEADLDRYFTNCVRRDLHGAAIKLAPTVAGVPDRLVILPGGRILLVELKASKGKLSEIQTRWHAAAAVLGVVVDVVVGLDGVDAWIDLHTDWVAR